MSERYFTAASLAHAAGCGRAALRVYERKKLVRRRAGEWPATYDGHAFAQLKLIVTLRKSGMELSDVEALLARAARADAASPAPAARALVGELNQVIRRVADEILRLNSIRSELTQARETLAMCSKCHKGFADCQPCVEDGRLGLVSRTLLLANDHAQRALVASDEADDADDTDDTDEADDTDDTDDTDDADDADDTDDADV